MQQANALAEEHQDHIQLIRNPENVGFARGVNQVLAQNPSDYYVIVNPDCVVGNDTIGTVIAALEQDPQSGLGSCLIKNTDGSPQKTSRRSFPTPWNSMVRVFGLHRLFPQRELFKDFDFGDEASPDSAEPVDAISGAFMVAKGDVVQKVGLLDEAYFMHCEDLDWCKRFWAQGYKVLYVPTVSVVHAKGISGQRERIRVLWHLHRGMIRFYKKFYREQYPLPVMWLVYAGVYMRLSAKCLAVWIGSIMHTRTLPSGRVES